MLDPQHGRQYYVALRWHASCYSQWDMVLDDVYQRLLGRPYRAGELALVEAELARASTPDEQKRKRAESVVRSSIEFQQRVLAILDAASREVRGRPFVPGERPELFARIAAAVGRMSPGFVDELARQALRVRVD
jgi:hypothetical protein